MSELIESRTMTEDVDTTLTERDAQREAERREERRAERSDERESKAALRALIADTVADEPQEGMHGMHEVEVEYERREVSEMLYLKSDFRTVFDSFVCFLLLLSWC